MNGTFLKALKENGRKNFEQGQASILIVALLAGYNAWEGETEDYARFARRWEAEVQSFFGENGEKFGQELPEVTIAKAEEVRRLLGLEAL